MIFRLGPSRIPDSSMVWYSDVFVSLESLADGRARYQNIILVKNGRWDDGDLPFPVDLCMHGIAFRSPKK